MKKTLITSALLALGLIANAQIANKSNWVTPYENAIATVSGNTVTFEIDHYAESEEIVKFNKISNNKYSITRTKDTWSFSEDAKFVELQTINNKKYLFVKDDKNNILEFFENTNSEEQTFELDVMNKPYNLLLNGDYVDENGKKYKIDNGTITIGGKEYSYTLAEQMYFIMQSDYCTFYWETSTTGINLYYTQQGEYTTEKGKLFHKLKNVSPQGRWTFLSDEIVRNQALWRFDNKTLRIMRNEIYARHGWIFNSADLKSYFSAQPWYHPGTDNNKIKLSQIEEINVNIIKNFEKQENRPMDEGLK
ncbi:MAG: YARHG domain-containing protein [Bacteroidales bacterium]|nr:YARHG domain-containing protein [Bacteroidales bacterium]